MAGIHDARVSAGLSVGPRTGPTIRTVASIALTPTAWSDVYDDTWNDACTCDHPTHPTTPHLYSPKTDKHYADAHRVI